MSKFHTCPRCNSQTAALLKIETGMRLGLQQAQMDQGLPDSVCPNCYQDLAQHVSEGAKLRAEQKAKEANRANMWANRVPLIKQGRELMAQKAFAEAAVAYEKYIRILEVVYEVEPGDISPEMFKGSAQNKELTIITSVYWDLIRIYDTNPRYAQHQMKAAHKLAEFSKSTPIFTDIARKAIEFSKKAKNKPAFEVFLKTANVKSSRCFIASAAFDSHSCPEVQVLCTFRDQILKNSTLGRKFIYFYYQVSPKIADQLDRYEFCKRPVRKFLRLLSKALDKTFKLS